MGNDEGGDNDGGKGGGEEEVEGGGEHCEGLTVTELGIYQ